jgi:hypothetical protein
METLIVLGFGILLTGMCVRWTGMLRVLTVRLPAGDRQVLTRRQAA